MRKSQLLFLAWALTLAIVVKTNLDGRQKDSAFQGIAESRELIINSDNAIEIRRICVAPGQNIEQGRLLVELARPELTLKINETSHRLAEIRLQRNFEREQISAKINELEAQKKV